MISFKILLYLLAFRFICILSSIAHTLSVDFYDEHSRNVYIINIVTSFMNYILYCVCFILDVNECKFFNGGCHQVCVDKTLGFECRCLPGFELQSNKRDCKGIILTSSGCLFLLLDVENCISETEEYIDAHFCERFTHYYCQFVNYTKLLLVVP